MAQIEPYSTFANALAGLAFPFQPGDILVVTRGSDSFQISPFDIIQGLTYLYVVPNDGDTLIAPTDLGAYRVDPAAPIAALTVNLPTPALDRQLFEVSTTQDISAFTATATGPTVLAGTSGGPTVLAANGGVGWQYDLALDTWLPRF